MRGIARLARFDLRRFRVPIAIVVGLELLRAVLTELVLRRGPLLAAPGFAGTSTALELQVLDGALWLASAITTAMLVQADHPADDRAFLRTRPIGPWSIALAKLTIFATLTAAVPFAATAVRLFAYSAPATAIAASAVQFVVIGGAVVLPAWALALATRTLLRFLAACAAGAAAWNVAAAVIVSWGPRGPFGDDLVFRLNNRTILYTFAPPLTDWQWVDARGWLVGLAITLSAAALLTSYYRTRRVIPSAIAAAALMAAPAILPAHPAPSPAPPDLAAALRAGVRVPALSIPSPALMAKIAHGSDGLIVFGDVLLPPLPANVSTERRLGSVHVTGTAVDLRAEGLGLLDRSASLATAAAARSDEPAWTPEPDAEMLFYLPPRDIEALRGRRVQVEAPVDLRFTRHVLVADVPVRAGVAFRTADYLLEIVSMTVEPRIAYVGCRFTRFPSFSRAHPDLLAFVAHQDGRVDRIMRPGFDAGFADPPRVGWAHGRTWTRQMYIPIADLAAGPGEARLRIVESRPAGEARVSLVARDVLVRDREPRPVPPPANPAPSGSGLY